MARQRAVDKISLTHNDTRNPGRIVLRVDEVTLDMPVLDAVELVDRLLYAIRMSGYTLTAKKEVPR